MSARTGPLRVAVLGSTGSIGRSTLEVIGRHPDRFEVAALAAHRSLDELARQVAAFRPRRAVVADATRLAAAAGLPDCRWEAGRDALLAVARDPEVDVVVNALVGAGWLQREYVVRRSQLTRSRFLPVAGVEIMMMVLTTALASALSRTPPPT